MSLISRPLMTMKQRQLALAAAALMSLAGTVSAKTTLCVWDVAGKTGDIFNAAIDYSVAMQKAGADMELKSYVDERVAVEDFRAGQCDAVMATSFRTKPFNGVAASLDSIGSATIVRNNKIDLPGSYEVVRKVIQAFSSPAGAKLMVEGNYEVGGIFPLGAAYPIVRDRAINSVEALSGKKIAAFDYDKAQGTMIQRIGAQPVSVDVTNIGPRFNNGFVDMVTLPAVAYKPLELYKGIGTKGGIGRFPIMIPTVQLVFNRSKFPEGFGEKSRQFWLSQFDRAMSLIAIAEKGIPAATWDDLPPQNIPKYVLMLREARIEIAKQGLYNKQTMNIIKRARCSVNAADAECSTKNEIE
ncbi:MAG TPA: putative solute-binding protein [Aquabacterium sp.]|uniref:putative solute-binding protein n=1 Tax=Aquabacterium sp. TaxID=1872578 RepID=UPI002E3389EB|nr:putative solute-binding protein [Aquabacterium sp.]HEX5373394.1 putative solute-binding protein [Aquabacterium sp.]